MDSLNTILKNIIEIYIKNKYKKSFYIYIPSLFLKVVNKECSIISYKFESVDTIIVNDKNLALVYEYKNVMVWQEIINMLCSSICFENDCNMIISIKIPIMITHDENLEVISNNFKYKLFYKGKKEILASISFKIIENHEEILFKTTNLLSNFFEENFILNDNNLEEDSRTFIEYGFDSLQLSSLEIKFYDLLNNHVTFEPLFLTKFNTPKKILDFIKSSKKVQKTKVEGNHEKMDKIVPTWNQKKFMFIKMYDFNYFSKLCEGVKIKLRLEKKFLLKIQEKINKIISKIDILRTTFNKKNNLVKLSCTETFIFLINSKKKMKNELTMSNYEIPLKIKVVFKENICKLIILLHHMAGDGQSFKLLLNYLYDNETLHGKYNQFSDYQQYELTYEKSQQYNNDKNFWKMTLKDIELEERTQAFNYNIETLSFKIPEVLMKKLAEIRKNKNISIFSLFVTIYKLLYYKIHQTTNKGIGIACENRLNFNFKNVIGPFMNIIPYFCPINIDANLSVILSTCNKQFIECLKHQMFSFDEIKKMTNNVNSDFFDVLFIQEPVKILDTEIKVSKIKPLYLECKEVWTFNCNQEYTIVDIKFNNNLINKTQMRTYVFGFLSIINDLNNSLSKKLKELNVYKSLSIEQKIKRNNYMSQSNIFEVIEKQSNLESTKIYEEENGTRYNMKYLNKECYEISLQLQEYYFTHYGEINTPDTPIVIHFERNIHLIKAVLCAIYSNLSIFPINPNCIHSEYNNWFLLDEVLLNKISQININEFNVQRNKRKRYDILYLTATSGSTGEPKIVCSELTGLLNLITEYTKKFFINEKSKIYQVVNYSFDIFFIDIFQGLFNGSDIILSKSKIPNLINFSKYQITHAYIMPAYLERLNRDKIKLLGDIQVLMYGGESLTESVLKELYLCSKELKIFQEFGLTEHSIYSNYKLMRVGENAKEIGPTFDNIGYGIIDADLKYLLPNSSGGKFFVTFNEGVSRGYIETPTLKNCFTFLKSSIKCLITGDLVSYDFTKKAFSFIGRTDSFIKIDGKQVNLTTIEECIFKNFPVQGIYITNFSNELNMNTYLVAHYTGKKQQNFKNILSKYIPSNWIPQYFIHHTEFPLNSNGKIDKNFLKKVKISEDNNKLFVNSVVITDSSLEHVLKVVRKYLYNENILPKDNIFDKGANSITLMMIIQELEDNYGVNVSIKDFFKHKTVESLIKNNCIIFKNEIGSNEKFLKDNPMDNIPLTYGQKFMWFANEYSLNDDEYIIKWELIFNKDIEITKIKYIIQCLLKINPTLRTVIVQNEFNLKQYCLSLTESFLNYDKTERSAPIDLSKDIPFQINIKSSKEIHLTFHHISVDGFSFQIIKDQVVKLFNDDFFDMKYIWDTSYHKYSIENNMKIKHLRNKSYYPIKYDKKTIQLFKNCVNINSNDITNDNISSYLLTILSNVLRKYSKDKLIVHIPISKRSYQYKSTVGYFVETYPFCVEFDEKDIRKRQTKIKERLLNVLSNEIPSYEDMITDSLLKQMEEQKYSLMLVYNNFKSNNIINVDKNTSIEINEVKPTIGKFDQTWIFELSENKLNINIEYCEQMFSYYEIVNLFEDFKKNLSTIDLTCRDKKIVQIIKNSLNIEDDIDIAKNFFELGGNSIIAALVCSSIRQEFKIPCNVSLLFDNPIIKKFLENLPYSNLNSLLIDNNEKYDSMNNIKINPFIGEIINYMAKTINYSKRNKRYNNHIEIQMKNMDKKDVTCKINLLLKIQPNLRSIVYFLNGKYYLRFLSLTESFLFLHNISTINQTELIYSYDDLFIKPWIFFYYNNRKMTLNLNIGHTIVDGSSMKFLNLFVQSKTNQKDKYADIISKFDYITQFKYTNISNNNEFTEYLKECIRIIDHQNSILCNFQSNKSSHATQTNILVLNKYKQDIILFSSENKVTPFVYLFEIIAEAFMNVLNLESLCFHVPFDIRQKNPKLNDIIGMYINTLPVLIKKDKNVSTYKLLSSTISKLIDNCDIFINDIITSKSNIIISNEHNDDKIISFNKIEKHLKSNISIFIETGKNIKIIFQNKCGFINSSIISSILRFISRKIKCNIIKHSENINKVKNVIWRETIMSIIKKQAYLTPNKVILKTNKNHLEYHKLIKLISRHSFNLKESYFQRTGETIVPETVIPIKVSKNINNVINILSILECGAAYNPIDESLPEGQINKYINESNALFFIDKNEMANIEPQIECMVNRTVRTNLAYVIYTSGTTGEPKGICINQTSVLNMILESTKNFYLSSDSIVYQFTRLSFDNSILEIFGTLCNGGVIYQRQSSYFDASEFSNDIITFKITHAMLFPGLVSTFNNEEKKVMSSLKYWIVGAEKLPINLLNEMLDKKVFTIQNYGPTETTGYCIFNVMRKNMNPQNIGKPIKNMRTLIKHNNSSNGELYVSGIGVTRGFLNKTENNDYFYNNWYKTGDLVEEADNGDIIFVERNDNQIKIRGFRVELTGIESVIIQFKNIKNCRVIYYEGKLFAIYVLENFKYSINEENLKNHCISLLPSYSIPNRFMKVSEIPLTKNMKLDKEKIIKLFTNKSLSKMNLESEVILKIWKKHLNVENISLIDNFFELGGNSINCVKIINEINSKFMPSLHITDIYRYETVENLMFNKKIKLKTNTDNVSTKYLLPDKFNFNNIQLSIQQNQMYIINHTKQYMHTHIMFVEEIELSSEKFLYLHNVFMKLICDNAMLRTIFVEDQSLNVITQRVLSLTECFFYLDIQYVNSIDQIKKYISTLYNVKFNLSEEPSIRPYVYHYESKLVCILLINHIITDAWTTQIINNQIKYYLSLNEENLWKQKNGKKNVYSYIIYSINQSLKHPFYNIQANKYASYLMNNNYCEKFYKINHKQKLLITKSETKSYSKKFFLSKKQSKNLLMLSSKFNIPPFVIFLSIFLYHLISCDFFKLTQQLLKYQEKEDDMKIYDKQSFSILFPYFNRETENDSQEMEQTIGLFLNNLFLMIHLEDCDKLNIESIVKIIKKNVEECFNYKDLPWPFLKAKLRSISKECHLHDIYFNCRYDMEYSDKKEKSQLVEELENTNNEHILEPIQINIDKIDDFFVVEYKIHGDLMKIDASSSVFQNFENIIKEVLYYDNEKDKNNIQNLVMKIIKELLSIQLDMEINLNDNFYELGGSSLLFIKLSNLLKSHFNVDIRMDELLSCESIGDILSLVKNNKKDDSNIRVILFPPLFGNIQPYKYLIIELKNIFKNIEFIPITYPKYLSNFTNFSSLIQFLNITFQEKYQFTDVPTLFIGSSFGSIIAYEFYINASNIQRSYIINIDGVADNRCNKNYSFEEHEKYVINYLSNIRESICSDIKNENLITGVVEHSWNLLQLAIEYLPTTNFEKEIILFSCEENINPFLSWNLFTNVNLQIINGNHDNVLNEKNCKQIAEYIKNILS